jgi:hypothetical protein
MTKFTDGWVEYGGTVIANSQEEAEMIADARGIGESIDGLHREDED